MSAVKFPGNWSLCVDPLPGLVFRLVLVSFPVDLSLSLSLSVSLDFFFFFFFSATSEVSTIAH